jgi:hypothetical protein
MKIDLAEHVPFDAYYLAHIPKAKRRGDQLDGLCPFHEDSETSFTVNVKTGLWKCFTSCGSGNVTTFHAKRCNLTTKEAYHDLLKTYAPANQSTTSPPPPPPPADKKTIPPDELDKLKEIPGTARQYLNFKRGWTDAIIDKYGIGYDLKNHWYTIPVYDEDGDLVNIRFYRPSTPHKKRELKSWKKGYGESRLFPYAILAEADGSYDPIFICEGEPDALCGISHGLACITQTAGAGTWRDALNVLFKGRHVIICYDNDKDGQAGTGKVAAYLPNLAKLVESIQWPDWMAAGEDLTDWFMTHKKTVEDLLALPRTKHDKEERDKPGGIEEDPRILALNEQHALIRVSGETLVLNEEVDPVFQRPDITFSSTTSFIKWYASQKITVSGLRGETKDIGIGKIWVQSAAQRRYVGITFAPGVTMNGHYNLYRGMQTEPKQGDWSLMSNHIFEIIANRSQESYNYVVYWLAHLFQHPGKERPGVAIVLRGGQGTGKGSFANQIGLILGNHYLHITNHHQFVGRFNNHLKDALFVFVDEGVWGGDKSAEGILKGMITEDRIMVEPKGRDPFMVTNYIRLLIASNNNWVVPVGIDERRMCVLDVSDRKKQDHEYFKAIVDQMDNGGREAMLYDLLELDIREVNLRDFPKTDALFDQWLRGANSSQKFWLERLMTGTALKADDCWDHLVPTEKLHDEYLEFVKGHNERFPMIRELFVKEIRKLCPGISRIKPRLGGERKPCLRFPDLAECRGEFSTKTGNKIRWDEDD